MVVPVVRALRSQYLEAWMTRPCVSCGLCAILPLHSPVSFFASSGNKREASDAGMPQTRHGQDDAVLQQADKGILHVIQPSVPWTDAQDKDKDKDNGQYRNPKPKTQTQTKSGWAGSQRGNVRLWCTKLISNTR